MIMNENVTTVQWHGPLLTETNCDYLWLNAVKDIIIYISYSLSLSIFFLVLEYIPQYVLCSTAMACVPKFY